MNWNRILVIALFDLRHSLLRLKGLVFLIPFLFFWYLMLKFLLNNDGELFTSAESLLFFSWLLRADIAQKLLILHPPSLSVFLIVVLGTTPLFAMLSGNDQLAGDSGRQTFRYFLTRCTRAEIFAGRCLSHYLLIVLATLLAGLLAMAISFWNDQHGTAETITYALHVFLLIMIYTLPFVAFMSTISALMSSAMSSLLMSVTIYTVLLLAGAYLQHEFPAAVALVPSGVKTYLFGINSGDLTYAVIGLSGYTLVYLSLGWLIFRKRNI